MQGAGLRTGELRASVAEQRRGRPDFASTITSRPGSMTKAASAPCSNANPSWRDP